jgi:flagellar motor switch protein FliN
MPLDTAPSQIPEDSAEEFEAAPRKQNLDSVLRIPVTVQVVLGSAMMPVSNLLKIGHGAVITLDRRVGEPVDVVVNGRTVARGELVVIDDENSRFDISLTEIIGPSRALD